MKNYFIPIIGTISAGKSTFLKSLLGTNVLQSGVTTTTKFVCLIKNSSQTSFYHVIPNKGDDISFEREGEEIKGEENIAQKIESINKDLSERKGNENDIFYLLETPILNIDNPQLLEQCYFMDIPGLNEDMASYIEIIFSIITLDNIIFEIMVFDSTNIGSDNILGIFKELEKKNSLKKSGNIFILNKIDQCTKNGEGEIIDSFKKYFYETFEDEKREESGNIFINIYQNYFVPMNSILYLAETKINDDFCSMLIFELFSYLEYPDKNEAPSFLEFIQKRNETLIEQEKAEIDEDDINENEMKIIENSVEKIKRLLPNIQTNDDFQLGINLTKSKSKKELKKAFLIHKNKYYKIVHSPFYNELQETLRNINLCSEDLASPPSAFNADTPQEEINDQISEEKAFKNIDVSAINELEGFLDETFKLIDPKNELDSFRTCLQTVRESILGRKIRIAFIGNISVGKSTVLNSIIGKDILPTSLTECTYRGVILRHKDIDSFNLYRTRLITRGSGADEYYYFEPEDKPYCRGINNVKSYLKNKNNDKNIGDKDAYIIVTGRLKIFDFIELDKDLIEKIEFIDLPGPDRKNNTFNEKEYYKKILKFSNCCIYINEPKTIDDKDSVERMTTQYQGDKSKVFPTLRSQFIKTCLFLINKSDSLEKEEDKKIISENIYKNISKVEKNIQINDMNISFFSGKCFFYYLTVYNKYVEDLDKNPSKFFSDLFSEYNSNKFYFRGFKYFIIKNRLSKIEEDFDLDLDDEKKVPIEFEKNIKEGIDRCKDCKSFKFNEKDIKEIIKKLYTAREQFLALDLLKSKNYSYDFFIKLKEVIGNSEDLQKQNLENSLKDFFRISNDLFKKEIKEETEKEKIENQKKIDFLESNIKPKLEKLFSTKENNIKDIFKEGREKCLSIITDEKANYETRLKNSGNDLKKASDVLAQKIKKITSEMSSKQEEEMNNLTNEIKELFEEGCKEFESKNGISFGDVNTGKSLSFKMFIGIVSGSITGAAASLGFGALSASTAAGAFGGPVGIAIGFTVGLAITFGTLISHFVSKGKKYKEGVEQFEKEIIKSLNESEKNILNDFSIYKDKFFKEFNMSLQNLKFNVNNVDEKKWEEIQKNYEIEREKIMNRISSIKEN